MRLFALLLILTFLLPAGLQGGPARAQEPAAPPEVEEEDDVVTEAGPAETRREKLERLLADLESEPNFRGGRRIANQISRIWNESGSDTVNLLMDWSAKAISKKNFALATDLLDQVTTLQPGFVEGWNRRATLYYLSSDYGRSLADIERVLQLEPRHFGALSGLAAILQRMNRDREALKVWYRVLSIYPSNRQAQKAVIELEEQFAGEGT